MLAGQNDNQQPRMLLAENEQISVTVADNHLRSEHEAGNDDSDMGSCINCAPCTAELDLTGQATDRMVDVGEGVFLFPHHFPLSDTGNNLESALRCDKHLPAVASSSTQLHSSSTPSNRAVLL